MNCLGSQRARSESPWDSPLRVPLSFSSCYDEGTNPEVSIWGLHRFPESVTVPLFRNGNGKEEVPLQGTSGSFAIVTVKRLFFPCDGNDTEGMNALVTGAGEMAAYCHLIKSPRYVLCFVLLSFALEFPSSLSPKSCSSQIKSQRKLGSFVCRHTTDFKSFPCQRVDNFCPFSETF